jgi:toxin ParE1/3/4
VTSACRLIFSPRSAADLNDIADYIARDNPGRAATFIVELETLCRGIAAAPAFHPARDDLAPGARMAVYGRYLIFYRHFPQDSLVRIERVLHGARRLPGLL